MSYGSPALDTLNRTYKIVLNHQTLGGDLVCNLAFGDTGEGDSDQYIQDFVDVIDGSTDFTVAEAKKTTPSVQAITAT